MTCLAMNEECQMSEITQELYEKFNQRFPEPMTLGEVAAELDRMNQQEAGN